MQNQLSQHHPSISNSIRRSICTLVTLLMISTLISCGDFIDPEESPAPQTETPQEPQKPQTPEQPKTPETPKEPVVPKPKPGETKEQKNWRLCEAERLWAFNARIIDSNALRLYQSRNFAPVFNTPGERQSGVEGWYPCVHALEMNGFTESDYTSASATEFHSSQSFLDDDETSVGFHLIADDSGR